MRIRQFLITILIIMVIVTTTPVGYAVESSTESGSNETYSYEETLATEGTILSFESHNPVYSINAYKGTTFEELGLPDELRVVMEITAQEKKSFVEADPVAESDGDFAYYSYGYIAPDKETIKDGEPAIYTINYFDGSTGYRVYGSVNGEEYGFFACDAKGEIIGKVSPISVTWNEDEYKTGLIGQQQKLTPTWSDKLKYEGEDIYALVTETDIEEDDGNHEEEVETQTRTVMKATAKAASSDVPSSPSTSTTYAGAVQNIKYYTRTSGNLAGGGDYGSNVPGTWKNYINNIFLNKGFNEFSFVDSGVDDEWKWNGTAATINSTNTNKASNNPDVKPTATVNNTSKEVKWDVYSVQQFYFALTNSKSKLSSGTIVINVKKDLDFNGSEKTWKQSHAKLPAGLGLQINGEGHTFYNICAYNNSFTSDANGNENITIKGNFINANSTGVTLSVNNVTFDAAFCVSFTGVGGGLFGYSYAYAEKDNYGSAEKVVIKNSLFYNGGECYAAQKGLTDYYNWGKHISPFGVLGSKTGTKMTACSVVGSTVYGADHVIGFITRADNKRVQGTNTFKNCFVTDTVICGTGGHSSGFMSCQMNKNENTAIGTSATDCFVNVDMYGSKQVAGFNLIVYNSEMTNCFVTGKIEGHSDIYGFIYVGSGSKATNCYSTALVGMRSESKKLAGFCEGSSGTYTNCYAAGEVGNHTTEMDTDKSSTTAGGFSYYNKGTYTNCYYDKQTTAMREWVTASRNTQKGQSLKGVTGVLTTDTAKAGNGLTSVPATGDTGFTGLNASVWYYEEGFYPQLTTIKNATSADWGSSYQANLARANSWVSVSTVYLDTWDEGYDWNSVGVRSKEEVSYARTPEEAKAAANKADNADLHHLGSEYTYDTVRSIISNFTSTKYAKFSYAVNSSSENPGATAKIVNWKTGKTSQERKAVTIGSSTTKWKVNHPGMEWVNITRTISSGSAWRPLRLIAFMEVDAGKDQKLAVDELYDHRADAEFTIMNSLTDDLVVGFATDEGEVWSTGATQGYPGYQAKPYEDGFGQLLGLNSSGTFGSVIDKDLGKHYVEVNSAPTAFDESENAWVYTEIWMTEENGKVLDEPLSVKVTGEGTNGKTLTTTEEQWMGVLPIGMGMHAGTKFEVTYYWMLEDGRYRTDSKTIELLPGEYDLVEKVYNEDGSANSSALRLGTVLSDNITVGENTSHKEELNDNPRGTKVVAAWLNDDPSQNKVTSITLNFSLGGVMLNGSSNGSEQSIIYDPKEGDEITVTLPYYGYTTYEENDVPGDGKYSRVVTSYEPIDVNYVYKVVAETQPDGSVMNYLIFDKEASYQSNGWSVDLENEGIIWTDTDREPFANMSIMQIEHDIEVLLTVSGEYGLSINKTDGGTDKPLEGVSFNLYEADSGDVRTLNEVKQLPVAKVTSAGASLTEAGVATDAEGVLAFKELKIGTYYYLIETDALAGYVELDGMVRLHRDTDGIIRMRMLDRAGNTVGEEAVYNPDPTAAAENGTVALSLDKWSAEDGGGSYVSTTIKNYQSSEMPQSGGNKEWLYLIGGTMTLIGLVLLLLSRQRNVKNGYK